MKKLITTAIALTFSLSAFNAFAAPGEYNDNQDWDKPNSDWSGERMERHQDNQMPREEWKEERTKEWKEERTNNWNENNKDGGWKEPHERQLKKDRMEHRKEIRHKRKEHHDQHHKQMEKPTNM